MLWMWVARGFLLPQLMHQYVWPIVGSLCRGEIASSCIPYGIILAKQEALSVLHGRIPHI